MPVVRNDNVVMSGFRGLGSPKLAKGLNAVRCSISGGHISSVGSL